MKNKFFKIEEEELDSMIREIALGPFGKKVYDNSEDDEFYHKSDYAYEYRDEEFELLYSVNSRHPSKSNPRFNYEIRVNRELLYPGKRINKGKYINHLKEVYNATLRAIELEREMKRLEEDQNRKLSKIRSIFSCIYPEGYIDDKIIIEMYPAEEFTVPGSYGDDYIQRDYNAIIKLIDDTVLYDTKKDIMHPGKWIDYTYQVSKRIEEDARKRAYEQNKIYKKTKEYEEKRKRLEYETNHTPIDDTKYFI